ncbi:MAG: MoxR family ATPase [Bowdeniella nasicola]|nr:MoxR family ATPase [Bowdeniella nasicola]
MQQLTGSELETARHLIGRISTIFSATVIGQDNLRRALISALLAEGHVLLESVPGLAKTTAAHTLASAISGSFHRIQCTPDLMPNDIVGTQVFNYTTGELTTQLGPVHANLVLLDEINRSSAKTQSAMLEAMQERQTTIGGRVYPVPRPFMVMATQNPIEEEGTYVLPEAQMDRFLIKEVLSYPSSEDEVQILDAIAAGTLGGARREVSDPITLEEVSQLQKYTRRVFVHESLKRYIVDIIATTRSRSDIAVADLETQVRVGASPRGAIALMQVAQALALMAARSYVVPDDIVQMRHAVLRHRIIRTYDAIAAGISTETIIDRIFDAVPVP